MHALGERLGEPVGERLEHDRAVVVVTGLVLADLVVEAEPRRDGEGTDPVWHARLARRHEVRERVVRLAGGLGLLLAQVVQAMQHLPA